MSKPCILGLRRIALLLLVSLGTCKVSGQTLPSQQSAFKVGETLTYTIAYQWKLLWVPAGTVQFTVDTATIFKKKAFHFVGTGRTYRRYDWFYKVRDRYESYADLQSLHPYRFIRDVLEGPTYIYNEYLFNHPKEEIYTVMKRRDEPVEVDTIPYQPNTFDVLSMIYHAREIDFSLYEPMDSIPFSIILDKEIHHSTIQYLGKEVVKTDSWGALTCIKFSPLLVEGTIFKGGDQMTVWVTDDKNKIPLYIESEILVGSIKARLDEFEGLAHPFPFKGNSSK